MTPAQLAVSPVSRIAVAVYGKADVFTLIPLDAGDAAAEEQALRHAFANGLALCGVLAIRNGEPLVRCEPGAECASVMIFATLAFIRENTHMLVPRQTGDSVDWLADLHALPDPRYDA